MNDALKKLHRTPEIIEYENHTGGWIQIEDKKPDQEGQYEVIKHFDDILTFGYSYFHTEQNNFGNYFGGKFVKHKDVIAWRGKR